MSDENITVVDQREPIPTPKNCKTPCCYGYAKAFCFPCYAKLTGLVVHTPKEKVVEAEKERG